MDYSKCKLYGISNKKFLSELLGIEVSKLKEIEKHFSAKPFEKERNGKVRTLYNASPTYKLVLKKLNFFLTQIIPPSYIYGGVKKRDYVMNAAPHKNHQYFMLLDIQNFFPSTIDYYVYKFFKVDLCMSEDIAKICTLLTTVPKKDNPTIRNLPQGFPTSPSLSFLSYFQMYERIYEAALKKNITFTCYYDDLTFSSNFFIHKNFKREIINIINEYKLSVNLRKSKLLKNTNGVKITGAVVRKGCTVSPNKLQKKLVDTHRELLELYNESPKSTEQLLKLCNSLQGCLSAIHTVEKERDFPSISRDIKRIRLHIRKCKSHKVANKEKRRNPII